MRELKVDFDINPPSIEADFSVQSQQIEAVFEVNATSGDKHYKYEQATASDVWYVNHGLNKKPSITVVDSADNVVIGAYEYVNNNEVILRFNSAFVGKAYFN